MKKITVLILIMIIFNILNCYDNHNVNFISPKEIINSKLPENYDKRIDDYFNLYYKKALFLKENRKLSYDDCSKEELTKAFIGYLVLQKDYNDYLYEYIMINDGTSIRTDSELKLKSIFWNFTGKGSIGLTQFSFHRGLLRALHDKYNIDFSYLNSFWCKAYIKSKEPLLTTADGVIHGSIIVEIKDSYGLFKINDTIGISIIGMREHKEYYDQIDINKIYFLCFNDYLNQSYRKYSTNVMNILEINSTNEITIDKQRLNIIDYYKTNNPYDGFLTFAFRNNSTINLDDFNLDLTNTQKTLLEEKK